MFINWAVQIASWSAGTLDLGFFFALGITLVFVGVAIIVAAIIIAWIGSSKRKGNVRGAGVIMIGPIPIIFGTDKKSVKVVLALALAVAIVILLIIVLNYWYLR